MAIKIAIVGGGVAGVSSALVLGNLGFDVVLFEKREALISGPPFCHLHAGGNLYRDISTDDCITLLRQSIDFAKLFPFAIDKRPTIFATPTYDLYEPLDLIGRLETLKKEYEKLVKKDKSNMVLGEPNRYFEIFSKEELLELAKLQPTKEPKSNRDWLIPFAKNLDFSTIKFPVIVVQEYGINLFRVSANSLLALKKMENVKLLKSCRVTDIKRDNSKFIIEYSGAKSGVLEADYLINAAGFQTGIIDDFLGVKEQRMVEFKAAYTTLWEQRERYWPEVIFHGIRGTDKGMGQFTPYCNGIVQLHAMRKDVTLFENGLVSSTKDSSYPKLDREFLDIIENGWDKELLAKRTKRAIEFLAHFFPAFKSAKYGTKPLYGAQQIPGSDSSLRVAEVTFAQKRYARCEIIKVSSISDMASEIVKDIKDEFGLKISKDIFDIKALKEIDDNIIDKESCNIAKGLNYPCEIGKRCNS